MILSEQQLQSDLLMAGVIRALALMSLMALVVICHFYGNRIQIGMDEQQRIIIRTILYIVAITTFPGMKFMRHVLLHLNQTTKANKTAKSCYLRTIFVSMTVAVSIGLYGFAMFVLGDSFNTLYIFVMLSALAMYLYRPKIEEYQAIRNKISIS